MNVEIGFTIAASILALCALATAFAAIHTAHCGRSRCESLESSIASLRRDLELATSISARTVRRVQRVEHEFSGVTERVDLAESRVTAGSESLDQAIDLARRGVAADRLEREFGLSSGEAALVARLHGRDKLN
jgi:septal ring factor EnvC (AmiA/AmiB activator)